MRLLLVTNDYPPRPGGIQQWLGNLVDVFPGDVRVLAPADAPATTVRGEAIVVRGRRRWMVPTPSVRRWIAGNIREFAPDVVLYGAPHPLTFLARRLRTETGVPYAVMTHGAEVTLPAAVPGLRRLLAGPLAAADARLAVSDFTAARVADIAGRPATTLGAGVDIERYHPAARPAGGSLVVGCVSRFVPRKGQLRVLRAARILARRGVDVRVMLVGRGRLEGRLRRRAQRWGVDTEFHVDVPWAELPDLYRTVDVFAMPARSRWAGLEVEGLGIVYLEASASGIPVIAGDSGGAPETVRDGETGFVVSSVDELVDRLGRLVADADLRAAMGVAGRRFVEESWTWPKVAERLVAALEPVVATD